MELTRWNPRHGLQRRHSDLSKLFDDFFTPFSPHQRVAMTDTVRPSVDIYEQNEKIIINAELPGIEKEDITVGVKGKVLTIGGERQTDKDISEENSYRRERCCGTFERSFNLGFEVNPDDVIARYEKGILTLELARPKEVQKKEIPIH